ncbi:MULTISPECIES: NUDIX domain-containing protein [unclassified Microcoleus]|uniref:bis(5'-nucleosyl)-tetraphosphatase n=1 Tax=unclassified Microcoleus TaxID=2642155 RepID=UPI002FD4AFFD
MKDECFGIVPIFGKGSDSLFLLIQHQAGHWAFPKGHANPGESPAETARREFAEETGICDFKMLDEPSFTEHYSFVKDGEPIEKTVTYFLGFVNSRDVVLQVEEVQNSAWVSAEEAVKLITFDANRLMFGEIRAYLDGRKEI